MSSYKEFISYPGSIAKSPSKEEVKYFFYSKINPPINLLTNCLLLSLFFISFIFFFFQRRSTSPSVYSSPAALVQSPSRLTSSPSTKILYSDRFIPNRSTSKLEEAFDINVVEIIYIYKHIYTIIYPNYYND